MEIVQKSLSYSDVLSILKKGDEDFSPSLSTSLDIEQYALKLSTFANFILLQEDSCYEGCIAYYKNNEGRFIYISHFWVSGDLQGLGYGKQMLMSLIDSCNGFYDEIRLEVVKSNPAASFYLKQGFYFSEDRGSKELLCLTI